MAIKKNVPYKVLKILWVTLVIFTIMNIVGVWVGWNGRGSDLYEHLTGQVVFGVISGILVLLNLIACAICAFLNQKVESRFHGFGYSLLAVLHLVFVILTFTIVHGEDNSLPTLFTVFLIVVLVVCAYFAFAGKYIKTSFGSRHGGERPIRREDLGSNPTEATVDQVANPENNPDRKSGRDEKTGIVSL